MSWRAGHTPLTEPPTKEHQALSQHPNAWLGQLLGPVARQAAEAMAGFGAAVLARRLDHLVIGRVADETRWPFPTWAPRARPYDQIHDGGIDDE